jgi:hypothetical protein
MNVLISRERKENIRTAGCQKRVSNDKNLGEKKRNIDE